MRKDILASGGKTATFLQGGDDRDSAITLHNVADENELPDVIDNSALFAEKKPLFGFNIEPLNDQVVVQRVEVEEKFTSLIIPDSAKVKNDTGIVRGVGSGIVSLMTGLRTPICVAKGDLVLYDKFAAVGAERKIVLEDGELCEVLFLREGDLLGKLTKVKLGEPHVELAGEPVSNQP